MPKKKKDNDIDRLFPGYIDANAKSNPKTNKKAKENASELGKKSIIWGTPHR